MSGKIIKRLVDNEQEVNKGQILMKIDNNDFKLSITAKENVVKSLKVRLLLADTINAELNAVKAQAQVARNEALYSILYTDSDDFIVFVFDPKYYVKELIAP